MGDPESRQVFAHVIVGIVGAYTAEDWLDDIKVAHETGIDGFALNIGISESTDRQLELAHAAAEHSGSDFTLFISFDFTSAPAFADYEREIVPRLVKYANHPNAAKYKGRTIVSTFMGAGFDWTGVRAAVPAGLAVIPNYPAESAHTSSIDGLFNWNAWPSRDNKPVDEPLSSQLLDDKQYREKLNGAPYMAAVSPWFFTHYGQDSYNKNWLYPSDNLLIDRWEMILGLNNPPPLLQIISWNDFGESHYIGPLRPHVPDVYAEGAETWVAGFRHYGWRDLMKPYIKAYKSYRREVLIQTPGIVYWYRPHPKSSKCADSIGPPLGSDMVEDAVFAAALSPGAGTLTITSGTNVVTRKVLAGITTLSAPMGLGRPTFALRNTSGHIVLKGKGSLAITKTPCAIYNFNAFAGTVSE